jgi:AraC family transcriptional regulator
MTQVGSVVPRSIVLRSDAGTAVHSHLPPHEATGYTSTSSPYAFGVSFTGHRAAVTETAGTRATTRTFGPSTVGLNGGQPTTWLQVREPSEGLEIHPGPAVLKEVAALTGCAWDTLDAFLQTPSDPVLLGICTRMRAAALGAIDMTELELDCHIRDVAVHVAIHYLGGARRRGLGGRLDTRRLWRVHAFLQENLHRSVSLAELADVAALSPYHFQRSFRRTTSLSPAQYAMALRMEHARRLLFAGASVRKAAAATGFNDPSYFRRCYKRYCGILRSVPGGGPPG